MELKGRSVDPWGQVVFDARGLVDQLMSGGELSSRLQVTSDPNVQRYNQLCREFDHPQDQVTPYEQPDLSVEASDASHQERWFTPEPWSSLDTREWLLERCTTEAQIIRVLAEWEMFVERDMTELLRALIYLVDDFRARGIVWGVGRGSSVASYCLFLIGIHKVDSMAFDLDVREFLK